MIKWFLSIIFEYYDTENLYPIWANMNQILLILPHKPLTRVQCIFKRCCSELLYVSFCWEVIKGFASI